MDGQSSIWERLAPLTGLIFLIIAVAVFSIGGSTPSPGDSAAKVQQYYADHSDKHQALAIALVFTVPFLLFFTSILRYELRRAGGTGQVANAAFAGGVVAAVGFSLLAVVHLALASAGGDKDSVGAVLTLNELDGNDFFTVASGMAVLVFAGGLSAVRHGGLPKWLGWAGIVIGVACFTPAGFFGFILSGVWVGIASIALTMARGRSSSAPAPAAAPPPAVS